MAIIYDAFGNVIGIDDSPEPKAGRGMSYSDQMRNVGQAMVPAGLLAGSFAPGAGAADAMGVYPNAEGGFEPSLRQNVKQGNYFDAAMQGLGLLGDATYAIPVAGAVVGPTVGTALKAPRAATKGAKAAKKIEAAIEAGYDAAKMAKQYPDLAPPVLAVDKKTGKEFLQKDLSAEAKAVEKARKAAQKEVDAGNYTPMFPVGERYYADATQYPLPGRTITDAMPKKQATIDKYKAEFDTPEARKRLLAGFDAAKNDPMAKDWYAMGQLEDAYIKELGPDAGRAAFRKDFAEAMAATTGGADPTSNLLMAHYGNFLRNAGQEIPTNAYNMPYPIGGRYASGNMGQYDKMINQGKGISAYDNPKRHNFAGNFMGHRDISTIDEQMSGGFRPGLAVPPGDSYGIFEGVVADLAKKRGVQPANFQDVAWAGLKGTQGKPMIQHVNEMIERTSRVTGKTPQEVLRGLIRKDMPMYSVAPVGLLGADYALTGEDK